MQWEYLHLLVNLLSVTFALSLSACTCCTNTSFLPICLYSVPKYRSNCRYRMTSTASSRSLPNAFVSRLCNMIGTNPSLRTTCSYTKQKWWWLRHKRDTSCSVSSCGRGTNTWSTSIGRRLSPSRACDDTFRFFASWSSFPRRTCVESIPVVFPFDSCRLSTGTSVPAAQLPPEKRTGLRILFLVQNFYLYEWQQKSCCHRFASGWRYSRSHLTSQALHPVQSESSEENASAWIHRIKREKETSRARARSIVRRNIQSSSTNAVIHFQNSFV